MKKFRSAFILSALLLVSLTGCSDKEPEPAEEKTQDSIEIIDTNSPVQNDENTIEANTETEEVTFDRNSISDELPESDYNGKEFRIMATKYSSAFGYDYMDEVRSEELTGDVCNDAIYHRNLKTEERFNTKITCFDNDAPYTYINTLVKAGTDECDLFGVYSFKAYEPINAGSVLNWNDIEYVNLKKPWHNSLANDSSEYFGKLYGICSDLSITSMLFTEATFFNTRLSADSGYSKEYIYDIVNNGEWTIDKLIAITSEMYTDTNGNGNVDADDQLGYSYSVWNAADVWLSAFDQKIVSHDVDGNMELTFMCEKTVDIINKLVDFHSDEKFINFSSIYEEEKHFANSTLVFAPIRFVACFGTLRDMEDEYAVIPYPKWNVEQEKYMTNADDKYTLFMIPTTVKDTGFVGIIYEALCAESYKSVYPAYYDSALKGKYSSDKQMAKMVDLIMEGRNFEFAFQFGLSYFHQLPYWTRECIQSSDTDISSRYAKTEKSLLKDVYDKLVPLYKNGN